MEKAASSGLLTKGSSFSVVMHSPGRQAPLASPRLLYGKQVIIDRLTAVV